MGCDRLYRLGLAGTFALMGWLTGEHALAQITPDETLGEERSVVNSGVQVRGEVGDRIEGGAQRGANLFHSFQEFNVDPGQRVYFGNPDDVRNILSRVTGGNPSNILGTLGVDGAANLFFLNPNGILFGENASLDVSGSFVATTADAIGFGDFGLFSATNPETPSQLLTIDPSAFFFNQLNPAAIENQSVASAGFDPTGASGNLFGLRVGDGSSILLLGGNVTIDGGGIIAFDGRIELGSVAEPGTVGLNVEGNVLKLNLPDNLSRSDITLTNGAGLLVTDTGSGSIALSARNMTVSGSSLEAGIWNGQNSSSSPPGNITLDAAEVLLFDGNSSINNIVSSNASGNSGGIEITARSLRVLNGSQIYSNTFGQGNSGSVTVNVSDSIVLDGVDEQGFPSGFFSSVRGTGQGDSGGINITAGSLQMNNDAAMVSVIDSDAIGNSGGIHINAGSVSISNGGALNSTVFGQGNSGQIRINATGDVVVEDGENDSFIRNDVGAGASGTSGGIEITANSLRVANGAQIFSNVQGQGSSGPVTVTVKDLIALEGRDAEDFPSGLFSSMLGAGQGNSGGVRITANALQIVDRAIIVSDVGSGTTGNSGGINISTGLLDVTNGGQIISSISGQGNSGGIVITANDRVSFEDQNSEYFTGAASNVREGGQGDSGGIEITTGSLYVTNEAQLQSSTAGRGNTGGLSITARDRVVLLDATFITEVTEQSGIGNAGDITITTGTLELRNGSSLLADTEYQGNAGNITITARDAVILEGEAPGVFNPDLFSSQISSSVDRVDANEDSRTGDSIGVGQGGNITITTGLLSLAEGTFINTETAGQGNAGNIEITADTISLDGGEIRSRVDWSGVGRGGNVQITTGSFSLTNGAELVANTRGQGHAGDVTIDADKIQLAADSGIFTNVRSTAVGNAGTTRITANTLLLEASRLLSSTSGQGNAGDILIDADNIQLSDSSVISSAIIAGGVGRGGDIAIQSDSILLTSGSRVNAFVGQQQRGEQGNVIPGGRGRGGDLRITAADSITLSGTDENGFSSGLFTLTERGASGRAGNIHITTGDLRIADGAIVVASTYNPSRGGDILIDADQLEATGGGQIVTSTRSSDNAGLIQLDIADRIVLSGYDPNFADRRERVRQYIPTSEGQFEQVSDIINNEGRNSGIFANTTAESAGNGGRINIETNSLSLRNRAEISASTAGAGNAGAITLHGAEAVTLDHSSIATEVKPGAAGAGGNIDLQTRNLTLNDRAQISAQSQERESAGNIVLNASEQLQLTDSDITTSATRSSGGDIRVNTESDSGIMILRGDSDITTNSRGNGGNITLQGSGIVAFDDSDILARSRDARGGNITLAAFFGRTETDSDPPFDGNGQVDVNADGQLAAGTITTPDTSFIQNSLADLPDAAIDTETLVADSCVVPSPRQAGRFIITGGGGLPQRPGNAPLSTYPTGTVRSIPEQANDAPRTWQMGDPIVEPQNAYRLEDGRVVLSRECSFSILD
jgi:filamentous hemagglutinin family protein